MLLVISTVLEDSLAVDFFSSVIVGLVCYFGSQNNPVVEGSIKNPGPEKSPPRRVKKRRHYVLVNVERFLASVV